MFPYLDANGFRLRTLMQGSDAQHLETSFPGWIQQTINSWSSRINAQLRKRYGNGGASGNALPLGQHAPELVAAGTAPPPLTLSGRPVLGSMIVLVAITLAGALGTATGKWSSDNGVTWTAFTSASAVPMTGTGLTIGMPAALYSLDNAYAAATPVPETVLQWITILTTWDGYQKRGRNPQDPLMTDLRDDRTRVLAEVAEAANSNTGLFDLPVSEDVDSAVTTGGPLFYSESSPYVSADRQECAGRQEDMAGFGTIGGGR